MTLMSVSRNACRQKQVNRTEVDCVDKNPSAVMVLTGNIHYSSLNNHNTICKSDKQKQNSSFL